MADCFFIHLKDIAFATMEHFLIDLEHFLLIKDVTIHVSEIIMSFAVPLIE